MDCWREVRTWSKNWLEKQAQRKHSANLKTRLSHGGYCENEGLFLLKKWKNRCRSMKKTIKTLKNELRRLQGKMTLWPARSAHIHEKWAFGVGESTICSSTVQEVPFRPAPFFCFWAKKASPPRRILGSEKACFLNIVLCFLLGRRGHRFWWLLDYIWYAFLMVLWS